MKLVGPRLDDQSSRWDRHSQISVSAKTGLEMDKIPVLIHFLQDEADEASIVLVPRKQHVPSWLLDAISC